jgi:hypothetical protein
MKWIVLLPAAVLIGASPEDCARCHVKETAEFARSGMALAMHAAPEHSRMTARVGGYDYDLSGASLTVSNGKERLQFPIVWSVGNGVVGQTYMLQMNGIWRESRVSYFPALAGLDLTMGAQNFTPHTMEDAAGRLVPPAEAAKCLGCHSTSSPSGLIAGVQCERCHGSSAAHLTASKPMRKLSALNTGEQLDFCGQCHRTWAEVAANGPFGVANVRFQPYRLASSKCYDSTDRRIQCTACHDPHRDVVSNTASYDSKCAACHSSTAKPATLASRHLCKVSTKDCASCHMPRVDLPGAHAKFADHRIRIARANEAFPN